MTFASGEEKAACLGARDNYWACLDREAKQGPGPGCSQLRAFFTAACPAHWVRHFDKKKSYLQFKENLYSYQQQGGAGGVAGGGPAALLQYEKTGSEPRPTRTFKGSYRLLAPLS